MIHQIVSVGHVKFRPTPKRNEERRGLLSNSARAQRIGASESERDWLFNFRLDVMIHAFASVGDVKFRPTPRRNEERRGLLSNSARAQRVEASESERDWLFNFRLDVMIHPFVSARFVQFRPRHCRDITKRCSCRLESRLDRCMQF